MKYLMDCGHDSAHVNRAFEVVHEKHVLVDVKFVVIPVFLLQNLIPGLLIFKNFFVNIALF